MKRVSIILTLILCLCVQTTSAFQYTEARPEAVDSITKHGVGSIYSIQFPDGGIRQMRVTGYQATSNGQELLVTMERADSNISVTFESENQISMRPVNSPDLNLATSSGDNNASSSQPRSSDTSNNIDSTARPQASFGSSLRVGLGSGLMSGLQVGIIEGSGYKEAIEKAYARIAELQKQMGAHFQEVEEARFNLRTQAIEVHLKSSATKPATDKLAKIAALSREEFKYIIDQSNRAASEIRWISTDPDFLSEARKIQKTLLDVRPKDAIEATHHSISKQALIAADQQSYLQNKEEADFLLSIAKTSADVLVGLDPFTGLARSIYESVTGTNLITGNDLSPGERTLAVLGVLTAGYTQKVFKAFKTFRMLEDIAKKVAPATRATLNAARSFINKTGNGVHIAEDISILRKINLYSPIDPKWGLTPKHLNKHFFGDGKYSLKKIDPQGSMSIWMQNLESLFQQSPERALESGVIEIMGHFPKTNDNGFYRMGVRLWDNNDGTFDLVTVLTKQD